MSKKVAIIGGGILGLSLAYELSHKGYEITILEKNSDWGGLASGLKIGDTYIEKYYHHWFKSDNHIQELIKELGLEHKMYFPASSMGIYINGEVHSFSGSIDLLKFKPLNIFNRIRAGVVSLYLSKSKYKESYEKVKAINWAKKYFGRQATEIIWEPLLVGKFGKKYKEISMSWLWSRIHDRASSRPNPIGKEYLGYMDGGFQLLIDTLVGKLQEFNVRMINNSTLESYKKVGKKHEIKFDGRTENFDIVVSTIPGPIFNKLFPVSTEFKKSVENIKYIGATCMILELTESITPFYWLNINDKKAPFLAMVEHTNFVEKDKYDDRIIVYIAKYVDAEDELFKKSEDELFDLYCEYLPKINDKFDKKWVIDRHFYKSPFAQHIVTTDYEMPDYETNIDGLYYANFTQIFPHDRGTNYAVEQAETLSKLIDTKHGN